MNHSSLDNDTLTVIEKTNNMQESIDLAKEMHWYSSVVGGTFFVVAGLIGNILSMILWNRKRLRSTTGTYLTWQAASNSFALICFFLSDSLVMMKPDLKKLYWYGVFYTYVGFPLTYFGIFNGIWITLGVTIDRYIMVCWINYSKAMCSNKRALQWIGAIAVCCFTINIPHFFTFETVLHRNETEDTYKLSKFGSGDGYDNYEFWVHCIFLVLVPWTTMFTLNMLIIRRVVGTGAKMNATKSAEAQEKAKKTENQLTVLLLTVTYSYLIVVGIQCIIQCIYMREPADVNDELVNESYAVAKLGLIINCSINFFLYCLSGRRFRREFIAMMGWNCTSAYEVEMSTTSNTDVKSKTSL